MAGLEQVPEQLNDISDSNRLQPINFEHLLHSGESPGAEAALYHPRDVISHGIALTKARAPRKASTIHLTSTKPVCALAYGDNHNKFIDVTFNPQSQDLFPLS